MSNLAPTAVAVADPLRDKATLMVELDQLQAEQLALEAQGFIADPTKPDWENQKAAKDFEETLRKKVMRQLEILALLRRTASGPARAGGKRAKRAPLDLEALESSVFDS